MSRRTEEIVFTAAFAAIAALFLILAWGLESRGRLGPILLAGTVLPLALFQLWRDIVAPPSEKPPRAPGERPGLAWALALPLLICGLGCLAAVGLHTALYVRLRARRSWTTAAIYGLLTAAPIYALARLMLRDELLTGPLWKLLS